MHSNKSYVFLCDVHFHSFHGIAAQERKVGNDFRVDIKLRYSNNKVEQSDNIVDAIDYAEVYDIIKDEMSKPSNLLENVCYRIAHRLFERYISVQEIQLKLCKLNPPMGADISSAGVEFVYEKD